MPLPHTPQVAIWSANQETSHQAQKPLLSNDEWAVMSYGNPRQQSELLVKLQNEATMPDVLVMDCDSAPALDVALRNVSLQAMGHRPVSIVVATRQQAVMEKARALLGLEGIEIRHIVDKSKGANLVREAVESCLEQSI